MKKMVELLDNEHGEYVFESGVTFLPGYYTEQQRTRVFHLLIYLMGSECTVDEEQDFLTILTVDLPVKHADCIAKDNIDVV